MELEEVLLKRRSCRKYLSTSVKQEDIDKLMHAAMSGPSACNKTPWKFYVIEKKETLERLRHASRFSNINAPLAIVVVGDMNKALPGPLLDYWIEDTSAATENILLEATNLGLGSLWCGVYPQKGNMENVSAILNLSDKEIPLNLIWIGYPDEKLEPRDQYQKNNIIKM